MPEAPSYDEDGNLVNDGRWLYPWDGENPLIAMETRTAAVTAGVPKRRLEFVYDGGSRRIRRQVYDCDAVTSSWTLNSERRFIYDQWNLMAEVDAGGTLIKTHVWGMDLSQSMQGAGRVGGLLLSADNEEGHTHFAAYDGNGNVTTLVDASTASMSVRYDYNVFGEIVVVEGGEVAEGNPFRFSTKYEDSETGLYYYGYRYYSLTLGRWLNRDPLEDIAFFVQFSEGKTKAERVKLKEQSLNPSYGFVENDPINKLDYLGLLIQLQWHKVAGNNYHTLIRVTPDCQATWVGDSRFIKDATGKLYVTFGAGPEPTVNGLLVSRLNRSTDAAPHPAGITLAWPTPWKDEDAFIRRMFEVDTRYPDNLDYDFFPAPAGSGKWWLADDGYNSNSFISGFIDAVGFRSKPTPSVNVPGWNKPAPRTHF